MKKLKHKDTDSFPLLGGDYGVGRMITRIIWIFIFLVSIQSFSQEIKYKEYSYSEFMELMKNEKDSVFRLSNAFIKYDSLSDKGFMAPRLYATERFANEQEVPKLVINHKVELRNVQFEFIEDFDKDLTSSLHGIIFEKEVNIENSFGISLSNCIFKSTFDFGNFEYEKYKAFKESYPKISDRIYIYKSEFLGSVRVINSATMRASITGSGFSMGFNHFKNKLNRILILNWSLTFAMFSNNIFDTEGFYYIQFEQIENTIIDYNVFNRGTPQFYCIEQDELIFKDNSFNVPSLINLKATNNVNFIGVNQFNSTISSLDGYRDYIEKLYNKNPNKTFNELNDDMESFKNYYNEERIKNSTYLQFELDQLSVFYNYFKEKHNTSEANKFYIKIKDLESDRLAYEHDLNPTFTTYFKLQINKFLKLFSNYGTEPERAVIVSLYVIFFFALIYLLFPNSWDSLGRKRLMHRFEFFQKYLRRKEGMHTLYLEGKQQELSSYEDFKTNLEKAQLELPSFFISWSKPLYNASMFSSRITSRFLKMTDVLQGKWQDLTPKQKRWKNIQIGFLLTLGLFYDLFIKVLNALMLSINTFTTLGFGEIPIKGLPRYLAIIQGFIGWFMLTIFSVSLISQLLN